MELRQLEAFAATMSTGSVSGAARLLGRSQPAISRLIQELEAEIGYALFTRSGPRVLPTSQGFLLYEEAERALASLAQVHERARQIAAGRERPLQLAATSALAVGLLPSALKQIEARIEHTPVHIRSAAPEQVVHAVLNGDAQWGVSSLPLEHKGLDIHWIAEAPCLLVLREDDPLAALPQVPLDALLERRVITMANRFRLRHRLDQAWAAQGGTPRTALMETNSSMNAQAAVRAGLGVAVLEPATVLGAPLPGLVARPVNIDIPFYFGVITRQNQPANETLAALGQALLEVSRATLPGFVLHEPDNHGTLLKRLYGATSHEDTGKENTHD